MCADETQRGGDGELIGKHREFVRTAIAIGVLANGDLVVAHLVIVQVVRVIDRLQHKRAALVIPGDVDRIDNVRLTGKERDFEAHGDLRHLDRVLRLQRLLSFGNELALEVAGQFHRLHFQLRNFQGLEFFIRLRPHRPIDRTFQQIVKLRQVPNPVIVARCRVKHPSLALTAHPRPRFVIARLQDGAIVAVIVVHVRFIPCRKSLIALGDRVLGVDRLRLEHARGVRLETPADQLDELRRSAVAGRGAVNRQKAVPALHEVRQRLELLRRHRLILVPVAIHHHGIEMPQGVRLEHLRGIFRVGEIDARRAEIAFDHPIARHRIMAGMGRRGRAEKQHLEPTSFFFRLNQRSRQRGQTKQQGKDQAHKQ